MPQVFYLFEIKEYEKYSWFTYEKTLEDYVLIERFVYEEGKGNKEIWVLQKLKNGNK